MKYQIYNQIKYNSNAEIILDYDQIRISTIYFFIFNLLIYYLTITKNIGIPAYSELDMISVRNRKYDIHYRSQ